MRKRILALVAICAFALCIGLVGCGSGDATKEAAKNFAGNWELSGGTLDGEELAADDIELMKSIGMTFTMTFTEDGKASLDMAGEKSDGTWKAKDATTIEVEIDGSTGTVVYKDGKVILEEDSDKMEFAKVEK